MTWLRAALMVAMALYVASGFYVVGGDEQAAVRRFGRFAPPLRTSGWHYDGPWPIARVDLINLSAVRGLSVGIPPIIDSQELMPANRTVVPAFLTGDNNLLQLRATVQYRLDEDRIADFLFSHVDVKGCLRVALQTALTDAAANSGVDYLHTWGLADLHGWLTTQLRQESERSRWGIVIEQVTLDGADPPLRVQADFLDVGNARAEAARATQQARTYVEQRVTAATAEARQATDRARQTAQTRIAAARGRAARFCSLVDQLMAEASETGRPYADGRRLAEQRLTLETWRTVLARVARPVIVDSRQPIDLQIVPPGSQR